MEMLMDLWLPILLSAVACFIASSIAWMVMPHHKPDMKAVPDHDALAGALKGLNLKPGFYFYPNCNDSKEMKSEAFKKRWNDGPWGTLNIFPQQPSFPRNLAVIFVEFLLVSIFVAYLAGHALSGNPAPAYLDVFQIVGTAAVLGYVFGSIGGNAFMGMSARFTVMCIVDAVVFALLTAGIFSWLWPDAAGVVGDAASTLPLP